MPRMMPWDDIPDSNVFPTGNYHVTGVKLEEVLSSGGKLMYNCDVQIMEHPATAPFTNMHFFENFVIGSDEDLLAEVAGTWVQSVGARRMKQMLGKAQIAEKADMDKITAGFTGCQFVIGLQEYKEPAKTRDGQDNPYAGQPRNKSTGFYKIGEKEPKIDAKPGVAPAAAPVAAPMAPPTLAQAAPVTPAVPAAPAPAAPAVTSPAPTAPVVTSFIGGLGGRDIPYEEFAAIAEGTRDAAQAGRAPPPRLLFTEEELEHTREMQAIAGVG